MAGALRAIVWGGAACAVLDGIAVSVQFGLKEIKPLRVWQGVASGLWGRASVPRRLGERRIRTAAAFRDCLRRCDGVCRGVPAIFFSRAGLLDFWTALWGDRLSGDELGCSATFSKTPEVGIFRSHLRPIAHSRFFRRAANRNSREPI